MDSPARNTPPDLRAQAVLHHDDQVIAHSVICEETPTGEPVIRFCQMLIIQNEDINSGIAILDQYFVMVPC